MRIRSTLEAPAAVEAQWLALGVFDGEVDPPAGLGDPALAERLGRLLASKDAGGAVGDVTPVLGAAAGAAEALVLFGLGPRDRFDAGAAFSAGVAVAKKLAGKPRGTVALALPDAGDPAATAGALTMGAVVGTRGPGLHKKEPARHAFEDLVVVGPPGGALGEEALAAAVHRGRVVGSAINLARDLANTPPAEKSPRRLAARIEEVAEGAGLKSEVWDEDRLRQERFGGLLGVAAGSAEPPAFVTLSYRGRNHGAPLALVGKGVTFDSGGLSLKPSASMEDMKADMTGAAVVVAAMQAVARLGLPVDVDAYLPLTENMTGGRAMKLGDVLTHRDGQTVEVLNTDAEGRLILADALAYAAEHRPARILDLATLTGACVVALGTRIAGLLSNDDATAEAVLAACRRAGERAWRLPLDDDFQDQLKSNVADFKNVGGKHGGAITAAMFLQQFVGGLPWAHLDIAGPSWADTDSPTRDVGATGCYVRTLVELIAASGEPSR